MNAPLPPHLVPGWVIDSVLDERPHSVVVAARGTEPVTPPAQPRFVTIVITRPGHEESAEREHDALMAREVIVRDDIVESTIVMWDGHGVAARVLRAGAAHGCAPSSDPLPPSDPPVSGAALPRPTRRSFEARIDALNAKPAVRRASWAIAAMGSVAALFAIWIALASQTSPSGSVVGAASWDPVTATMSVARDGHQLTFQMGEPGDEVLLGDWEGNGARNPALYRPATGEVWLFTEWAGADHPASPMHTARTVAHGRAVVETKDGRDVVTVYPIDAPAAP